MSSKTSILTTTADELMDLVRKRDKITIEEVSKILNIPMKTVQGLVDFLVEEKVLDIEYKFTTPYIYLSKKANNHKPEIIEKKEKPILLSKEEFFEKAKARNIDYAKIESLWRKYLEKQLGSIKEDFFNKAKAKNLPEGTAETLWQKYLSYL